MSKRVLLWLGAVFLGAGLLLSAGVSAQALGANPLLVQATQADGTVIRVAGRGDEFFHWSEDQDGHVIAYDAVRGNWCYARLEDDALVPGDIAVGSAQAGQAAMLSAQDLAPLLEQRPRSGGSLFPGGPGFGDQAALRCVPEITQTKATQPLLVLLIEYNDQLLSTTTHHWSQHFFGSANSVNSYYKEVSGAFGLQYTQPAFTKSDGHSYTSGGATVQLQNGVMKVKLNKNYPNTTGEDAAALIQADVSQAFDAAKLCLNLDNLQRQSNHAALCEELNVIAVFAGYDASALPSNPTKQVWAHASFSFLLIDGRQYTYALDAGNALKSYAVHGELYDTGIPMPIGASAHELGHLLGLPDLYSYADDGGEGIGGFSLMAGGSWGYDISGDRQPGSMPSHLDALSKLRLGFAAPSQLETFPANAYNRLNLRSFNNNYNAAKITSEADSKQYFLLENRQLTGYDKGLSGLGVQSGGVLVYHIDERVFEACDPLDKHSGGINDNNHHKAVDLENFTPGKADQTLFRAGDLFNATTTDNSNFHQGGHSANPITHSLCHPQTIPSGVELRVNSASGNSMEVDVGLSSGEFVAVNGITLQTDTVNAGTALVLTGIVDPDNATYQSILWAVKNQNGTGARITDGNIFTATTAGTAELSATILNGFTQGTPHVETLSVTVNGSQENTPAVYVDYLNETLRAVYAGASYTINGSAFTASATGDIPIAPAWMTGGKLEIIKKGNGTTTFDSLPQYLTVPARPAAPNASGKAPTAVGGSDGGISGTTAAMEYRPAGSGPWLPCSPGTTIVGPAGSYQLRTKALEWYNFYGLTATITVPAGAPQQFNVSLTYRDTLSLTPHLPDTGITWESNSAAITVGKTSGLLSSLQSFNKTPSAVISAYRGNTLVATFHVSVAPSFGQWLLIILLFGWIWY